MKKVGKYVIITLLLLLGLCCVGVLYLFFIPNSQLFNITYINNNEIVTSKKYHKDLVTKIELNSRAYDVNILSTEEENISVELYSNAFGFVLTKHENATISETIKNNTLTFDINEAYGFATKNNSHINLYLPIDKEFDLSLSNTKALTKIDSTELQIRNLNYSTNNGDININNCNLKGNLNFNLNKAICKISDGVKTKSNDITKSNNVSLELTSGKFYANYSTLGDINILKNERGVVSVKECNIITENVEITGGQIYAETISHINVNTSDTKIVITKILNGAIIDLSGSGSVEINTLIGSSSIITNSGNIKVDNCESSSSFHTDSGNITVNNAKKTVIIKSNYGESIVNFSSEAPSYSSEEIDKSRTLYATIYNGKLTATGVEHVGVANNEANTILGITVTGNGRVDLSMRNVCGENAIVGKNGNVNIVIEDHHENFVPVYKLTTNPNEKTKGNVRVNLLQIPQYNGYSTQTKRETYVNCKEATYDGNNSLTVSTTTGDLTILDSKLA